MTDRPRITALHLRTAAPLLAMVRFYGETMGLELEDVADDRLTVLAGQTRLTFEAAGPDEGEPYYHFACNIPENLIAPARDWLARRVEVLPTPPEAREAGYPDEARHFQAWNAHALYVYDPAGNIVELIARHDMKNARKGDFDSDEILCISEIAFASDDVNATARLLQDEFDLDQYKYGDDDFRALGDEQGLLLVFKTGRMMIGDRTAEVFPASVTIRADVARIFALPDSPYLVTATP